MAKRDAVRGTLAHRAVLMPFGKPWHRSGADTYLDSMDLPKAVDWAIDRLLAVANDTESLADIIDPAGPWWSKAITDWIDLEPAHRGEVLARFPTQARTAARAIDVTQREECYTWLRSEVPLGPLHAHGGNDARCDLLAGKPRTVDGIEIDDIEIKFRNWTTRNYWLQEAKQQVQNRRRFVEAACRDRRRRRTPVAVHGWVLHVDDESAHWVDVDAGHVYVIDVDTGQVHHI